MHSIATVARGASRNYDVLVAALYQIRKLRWRLVLVGDITRSAPTVRELQAQIARLGLCDRIDIRGAVSPEQVAALYSSSDIFVLSSRFEGYGMAFTEALAHGLPVVGTRVGAVQNVPEDTGVLVPVDNPDPLATALRRLIENPQERERLAAGRARSRSRPGASRRNVSPACCRISHDQLQRELYQTNKINHLRKSGMSNRSIQSLGFLRQVSHHV